MPWFFIVRQAVYHLARVSLIIMDLNSFLASGISTP